MITKQFWDQVNGKDVFIYTLKNAFGESVDLLSYGAAIHRFIMLDKNGELKDVVLGAKDGEAFKGFVGEGIAVGRCANRIAKGECVVNGKKIVLEKNSGELNIHSGQDHYGKQFWEAEVDEATNTVRFYLEDQGKSGFNCVVHACISYTFHDDHQLKITYDLDPEDDTVLSPTNHSYFNLDQGDVRDLELTIHATNYAPRTENKLPEGDIVPVAGTVFDYTNPTLIGEGMNRTENPVMGYDDNWILDGEGFRKVARLHSNQSGRTLNVYTDMPGLVCFVGGPREPVPGKDGRTYGPYSFICLETQYVTNAVNCPQYVSPVHLSHEKLHSETVFEVVVE